MSKSFGSMNDSKVWMGIMRRRYSCHSNFFSDPWFPISCVQNNNLYLWCLQLNFLGNSVNLLVDSCSFLPKSDAFLLPPLVPTRSFPGGTQPSCVHLKNVSFCCFLVAIFKHLKGRQAFTELVAWFGGELIQMSDLCIYGIKRCVCLFVCFTWGNDLFQ